MPPPADGQNRFGQMSRQMHLQRDISHMRKYPWVMEAYNRLADEHGGQHLRGIVVGPNTRGIPEATFLVAMESPGYGANGMRPVAAIHPDGSVQTLWKDDDDG